MNQADEDKRSDHGEHRHPDTAAEKADSRPHGGPTNRAHNQRIRLGLARLAAASGLSAWPRKGAPETRRSGSPPGPPAQRTYPLPIDSRSDEGSVLSPSIEQQLSKRAVSLRLIGCFAGYAVDDHLEGCPLPGGRGRLVLWFTINGALIEPWKIWSTLSSILGFSCVTAPHAKIAGAVAEFSRIPGQWFGYSKQIDRDGSADSRHFHHRAWGYSDALCSPKPSPVNAAVTSPKIWRSRRSKLA